MIASRLFAMVILIASAGSTTSATILLLSRSPTNLSNA
jgi:hypothetical protein